MKTALLKFADGTFFEKLDLTSVVYDGCEEGSRSVCCDLLSTEAELFGGTHAVLTYCGGNDVIVIGSGVEDGLVFTNCMLGANDLARLKICWRQGVISIEPNDRGSAPRERQNAP